MKKLLNTLYVTSENSYLALDGEMLLSMKKKMRLEDCRYIIWKESYRLDTVGQVRH